MFVFVSNFKILEGDPLLQHFYELQPILCEPQIHLKFKFLGFRSGLADECVLLD